MAKIKQNMIETEEILRDCLNNKGMTNMQALELILKKKGYMMYEFAQELLMSWRKEDENESDYPMP